MSVRRARRRTTEDGRRKTPDSAVVSHPSSVIRNRRRLWVFRLMTLTATPILTLLLLEAGLRLVGYGFSTAAMIPRRIDGVASYCDNFRFAWRFFPPALARTAESFAFPASKTDNAYRIFILGESAAAGTPDGSYSFGRILKVMLRRQYPKTDFQVITVAMPAINSHVIRQIAKDCVRHQPDLFIVYMGHNEVVGPYGAGTVFDPLRSSLSLIRLGIAVKATRVGQLVTALLQAAGVGGLPQTWQGMQMFLGRQVAADDSRLQTVYHHFQRNLEDIRRLIQDNGTPLILCTVASNLKDNPPFASQHRSGLTGAQKQQWDKLYRDGTAAETAGDRSGAIEHYLDAAQIDDRYAELQFRLGRCYWQNGQFDLAKDRFVLARDLDTLRFRADNRINEVIRQVAQQPPAKGVQLLDVVKLFEDNSPHATPGEELFHEHVHMTFSGNYLLATAIFDRISHFGFRIADSDRIANPQSNLPVPSESQCEQDLAYTLWDQHRVAEEVLSVYVKQPPFTNQIDHSERVRRAQRRIGALKAGLTANVLAEVDVQYRQAIEQKSADWPLHWNYGVFLERRGDLKAALRQYEQVSRLVPQRYETIAKLGQLSGEMGDLDTAIARNREALRTNPLCADAWFNMGLAYQLQQMLAPSVECYSRAIRCKPDHVQAYLNLGVVLHDSGRTAQAVETYRKALTVIPSDVDLRCNLALMLVEQGHRQEALEEVSAAERIDPNAPSVRKARATIK